MIMEKKEYIAPSLKALDLDEELLASMSGGGDVNIDPDPSGEEGDGSDAAGRIHYSVWDEE